MGRAKLNTNMEPRVKTGIRIYDTAVPQLSVTKAAKLAGISRQALYQALTDREALWAKKCPHCHRAPSGKVKTVTLRSKAVE